MSLITYHKTDITRVMLNILGKHESFLKLTILIFPDHYKSTFDNKNYLIDEKDKFI